MQALAQSGHRQCEWHVPFGSKADKPSRPKIHLVRFGSLADIRQRDWNVRFVPIADIDRLFDHFVGLGEYDGYSITSSERT
jgi:hypothetical protein